MAAQPLAFHYMFRVSHTCQVLLVEDDSDDAFLFMRAASLTCPNMVIAVAGDPLEARKTLQLAATPTESVSLIVSDLKMPRVNGIEFISWIRSQPEFESVPVILLSSSSEMRDVRDAYAAGASLYMVKPAGGDDYKTLLEQIGNFWINGTAPTDKTFLIPKPRAHGVN